MLNRKWTPPNVRDRLKKAEEKVKQAHDKYGCTWMYNQLAPYERICSVCGAKVHCPACVPVGVAVPSAPVRYCVEHMLRGGRV